MNRVESKFIDKLETALAYIELGWAVFPLVPNQKIPLTKNGFKNATRDANQVKKWWTENPDANIGIATGKVSGIVVVDVDVKNGAKGLESLATLNGCTGTLTAVTPSGGRHLYYLVPEEGMRCRNGFLPGIDLKADGGYVVVPGSNLDGKDYEWLDPESAIITVPDRIIKIMQNGNNSKPVQIQDADGIITEGQRNDTLASMAGAMRRKGMAYEEIVAALKVVNAKRCSPPLLSDEVETIAKSICNYKPVQLEKSWHISASEFLTKKFSPTKWLVENLWMDQCCGFFAGLPKSGKTWMGLEFAICITTGSPVLGKFNVSLPGPVVYVAAEEPEKFLQERLKKMLNGKNLKTKDLQNLHLVTGKVGMTIDTKKWQEKILTFCRDIKPKTIFFDPFVRVRFNSGENKTEDIQLALNFLRRLQQEVGCSVIIIHHFRKQDSKNFNNFRLGNELRGSGDLYAWMDSALYFEKLNEELHTQITGEHRNASNVEPFMFSLECDDDTATLLYQSGTKEELKVDEMVVRIVEFLRNQPGQKATNQEIQDNIKGKGQLKSKALEKLLELKKVDKRTEKLPDRKNTFRDQTVFYLIDNIEEQPTSQKSGSR